jgi:hypothetical protein
MQIFEYTIETIANEASDVEEHLNDYGKQGWELVSVIQLRGGGTAWNFKRVRMNAV